MALDNSTLVALNRGQYVSERDTFTIDRYSQFVRHFPDQVKDVMDIGCNTGRGGAVMINRLQQLSITGLDCVPDRLAALDPGVYKQSICGFADKVDLPDGSFDAIVAGEIIEHIPPMSVVPSLCECFRLLRLHGRLMLTTPNPHFLRNKLQGKSVLLDPSHVSQHTIASMRRKLEDVGFSSIRVYGSGKMSRYVGQHFPIRAVYGSYLAVATKW